MDLLVKRVLYVVDIVARLLGEDNYREGMATIFEALQHPELNQHVSCLGYLFASWYN